VLTISLVVAAEVAPISEVVLDSNHVFDASAEKLHGEFHVPVHLNRLCPDVREPGRLAGKAAVCIGARGSAEVNFIPHPQSMREMGDGRHQGFGPDEFLAYQTM
jgi:hypothetical protein